MRISDRHLQVTLKEPDRDFLTRLTVLSTAVVPRESVEQSGGRFDAQPVGSGPFKLARWVPGEFVLLEKNPAYGSGEGWQPKPPKVERVRFDFFRSEAQIAKAFADGLLDVREVTGSDLAQLPNLSDLDALRQRHAPARLERPGSVCRLHLLAPMIGPEFAFGASAALRRSLAASFDHEQLIRSAVGPLGRMTRSIMLPKGILTDGLEPEPGAEPAAPDSGDRPSLEGRTVKVA